MNAGDFYLLISTTISSSNSKVKIENYHVLKVNDFIIYNY